MEGSLIRGPFAVCQGAIIKMGAKIYGPTTVGPYCKVGGEVNNSVFFQNSNKGHDGFLGNSVLGEYPTLKEAITMLRDQGYGSVALHRFVAIQEGDGIVMPITYRMRIVGMYDTRQGVMVMVPGPEASIMERIFATLNLEM